MAGNHRHIVQRPSIKNFYNTGGTCDTFKLGIKSKIIIHDIENIRRNLYRN